MLDEVRRCFDAAPGPVVAAVSGGPDSVALVRALHALPVDSLAIAHVNHLLRSAESDGDEAFVRDLAAELGVDCHVERSDVASLAAGTNLEETARRVRYQFFASVAANVGARWIATGHTADDQAETVLHRLIRGAGLQGLRGIARQRGNIIRPLLDVSRSEVLAYLETLGQSYRHDSSNTDPRFTRNRIRAELLPLLQTFNPDIVATLGRVAEQAGEAFDVLEEDAVALARAAELPRAGERLVLDATVLAAVSPYRVRELFRYLWKREAWPVGEMRAHHWSRLVAIARGDAAAADFPGGIHARLVGRALQVGR